MRLMIVSMKIEGESNQERNESLNNKLKEKHREVRII